MDPSSLSILGLCSSTEVSDHMESLGTSPTKLPQTATSELLGSEFAAFQDQFSTRFVTGTGRFLSLSPFPSH